MFSNASGPLGLTPPNAGEELVRPTELEDLILARPADHPDFFRLPPPAGRSRESTIRLDRQGRFFHDTEPVTHPGMARAFATWIGRHPDNGRYILNNGWDWTYFEVEDAPFCVDGVEASEGRPVLVLSDGSREPLEPAALRSGDGEALYVRVKRGDFEARFRQAAQLGLAPWLEEAPGGQPSLVIAGVRYLLS